MIVYKYGALKPTDGFDSMLAALASANHCYNDYLEIELWVRACRHVKADKSEVAEEARIAKRTAYARYVKVIGIRTVHYLSADAAKSASTRWRCWGKSGRFRGPWRRFDGTGYLAAGSQHNVGVWAVITPGALRAKHASLRFRLTSETTIVLPMVLDRPLPTSADIERCTLHVNRVGDRWVYSVGFTIRNAAPRSLPTGTGTCSINFGWRKLDNGDIRVATVVGDHGVEYLTVPAEAIAKRKHAESLAALADGCAAKHLGSSRGRARARREALRGVGPQAHDRIHFDPAQHTDREHWAKRDRHLYSWECAERSKMIRQRCEAVRLWVRALRGRYAQVTIENYSFADLVRQARDAESDRYAAARHVRFLVAPGALRAEIAAVFSNDCQDLFVAPRTKKCSTCHKKCEFDAAADIVHTCEHCGAEWDQDINNAANQQTDLAAE